MDLILQAVKALFRKVRTDHGLLSAKIANAQTTANAAQTAASKAQTTANAAQTAASKAQTTANAAQTAAKHVLSASISADTAIVYGDVRLEDGKSYTIIPTSDCTNFGAAKVRINNVEYYLWNGLTPAGVAVGTKNGSISANLFFRANIPVVMVYSAKEKGFYVLSKLPSSYVQISASTTDTAVPEYVYGAYSITNAKKYKYMRVKSSTEGSSKLFDITVDDSGTITATEVTA